MGNQGERIVLEAKVENLDELLDMLNAKLNAMDCPTKQRIQLDVAVEELFVNIAHYAYEDVVGNAVIYLNPSEDDSQIEITFEDEGTPYNPLEKEDPNVKLSAEERQIGGLGIYMVKKSMDGMEYEFKNGKNRLTIRKKLKE